MRCQFGDEMRGVGIVQPLSGLVKITDTIPGVATRDNRASQPRAEGCNPVGIGRLADELSNSLDRFERFTIQKQMALPKVGNFSPHTVYLSVYSDCYFRRAGRDIHGKSLSPGPTQPDLERALASGQNLDRAVL